MQETWKPLAGEFEGWPYEVSDRGRCRRNTGRLLRLAKTSDGYLRANMCRNGVRRSTAVSRLVAAAFIGLPPSDDYQINHKDGDKSDNSPSNLEWVTCKENQHHAFENGLRVLRKLGRYKRKLTVDQVRAARTLHSERGVTQTRLAKWFGVSAPSMRSAIIGATYPEV